MGKAARKKRPTTSALGDVERSAAAFSAQQQFVNATISMGWQMALMVVIPVFLGVKLDEHFDTQPSYTLAALFLAVGGAIAIAAKTISNVKKDQEKESKK